MCIVQSCMGKHNNCSHIRWLIMCKKESILSTVGESVGWYRLDNHVHAAPLLAGVELRYEIALAIYKNTFGYCDECALSYYQLMLYDSHTIVLKCY